MDGKMMKRGRAEYNIKYSLEEKVHMAQFKPIQQTIQLMDG